MAVYVVSFVMLFAIFIAIFVVARPGATVQAFREQAPASRIPPTAASGLAELGARDPTTATSVQLRMRRRGGEGHPDLESSPNQADQVTRGHPSDHSGHLC